MISSIFRRSKPINYIVLVALLFVLYWLVHYLLFDKTYAFEDLTGQILIVATLLLSIFIADFIIKRNKLTLPNSLGILFYILLIMLFPETLMDPKAILCSFFLLLSLRRLISIRSLKAIRSKIFDATFWVMIASLCYEWAVLYLLLIFVAIYAYGAKNIKNWLVPFAAIFSAFMLVYGILILANHTEFLFNHYTFSYHFEASYYSKWFQSSKLAIYIISVFIAMGVVSLKLTKSGLSQMLTIRLIAFSFILGLAVNVFTTASDVYPIMITFFPAIVFFTNYITSINKAKWKEIILMVSILVPFLMLIASIAMK